MSSKQKLGQFYTTNYNYILQGMQIPKNKKVKILEPFAGKGDLFKVVNSSYTIEAYDIDPKTESIIKRDTLNEPPDYKGKFVLTNPPYLARNKSNNKSVFDKYGTNDLYKCFIEQLIADTPLGGIIIIPLNFWCSIRKSDIDLRRRFIGKFSIVRLNIFEEKVFSDTTYTVCCFQFINKEIKNVTSKIVFYPSGKKLNDSFNENNNYTIGGDIYKLEQDAKYTIDRVTKNTPLSLKEYVTNILVKCIDDNETTKISMSVVKDEERYIDNTGKLTSRSYATLLIRPSISIDKQKELVDKFNKFIEDYRDRYHSLFLSNYRESKVIARKRISFGLVYEIVNYLLKEVN